MTLNRWRLRREYRRVKAENDLVFRHAYACSAGVAALAGRGEKARLRFAFDTLKLNDGYRREKELLRQMARLAGVDVRFFYEEPSA